MLWSNFRTDKSLDVHSVPALPTRPCVCSRDRREWWLELVRSWFCSLSALWCLCIVCCHDCKTTFSLGSHILDCVTEMVMAGRERIPVFQYSIIFNQTLQVILNHLCRAAPLCLEKKTRWIYFPSTLSAFHRLCHIYFESMAPPSFLRIFLGLSLCILLSFNCFIIFYSFYKPTAVPQWLLTEFYL